MEKKFESHGVKLNFYNSQGKTDTLYVLLHGIFNTHKTCYGFLIPKIEMRGHSVLAVDLLGHGKSSKYKNISVNQMVQMVFELIESLPEIGKDKRIVVCGYSLGSIVGQRLSFFLQSSGYSVSHLVLFAGFYHILDPLSQVFFKVSMNIGRNIPEKLFESFRETEFFRMIYRIFMDNTDEKISDQVNIIRREQPGPKDMENLRSLFDNDLFEEIGLDSIEYMVINIRGAQDMVCQHKDWSRIASKYKQKCLSLEIPEATHGLLLEKPDEVDRILSFLE